MKSAGGEDDISFFKQKIFLFDIFFKFLHTMKLSEPPILSSLGKLSNLFSSI
jgi:hypothetical protein